MMKKQPTLSFILASLLLTLSCGEGRKNATMVNIKKCEGSPKIYFTPPRKNENKAIVEDLDWNDITSIPEDYSHLNTNIKAVGSVNLPKGLWCSGFLISEDIFMTNAHCIKDTEKAKGITVTFNKELGKKTNAWKTFDCSEFIGSNEELDFTLVRCKESPGLEFGHVVLDSDGVALDSEIYLIHQNCNYLEDVKCEKNKKLSPGRITSFNTYKNEEFEGIVHHGFDHTADTLGGTSGAPVFSLESNKVVGLHHVSGADTDENGHGTYNSAIEMKKIVAYIKETWPDLAKSLVQNNIHAYSIWALGNERNPETITKSLETALNESTDCVRENATEALAYIGEDEKISPEPLIRGLSDKSDRVRRASFFALGQMKSKQKEIIIPLLKNLGDKNPEVRNAASNALAKFGKDGIMALVSALADKNNPDRQYAANTLGKFKVDHEEIIPILIEAMVDSDYQVRTMAVESLTKFGKVAVPPLVVVLSDSDSLRRAQAISALGWIGPESKEAVPDLIEILKDYDSYVRISSAWALGKIGSGAKEAVPGLIAAIDDEDENVKQYAAGALGRIGPDAKEATPKLIETLGSSNKNLRLNSIWALGVFGPGAKEAIPSLAKLFDDSEPKIRKFSIEALGKIGKEAINTLIIGLGNQNRDVRANSSFALVKIGKDAEIPLALSLSNKNEIIRINTAGTLASLGPISTGTFPSLAAALGDNSSDVRTRIAYALGQMNLGAKEDAIKALTQRLKEETNSEVILAINDSINNLKGPLVASLIP